MSKIMKLMKKSIIKSFSKLRSEFANCNRKHYMVDYEVEIRNTKVLHHAKDSKLIFNPVWRST